MEPSSRTSPVCLRSVSPFPLLAFALLAHCGERRAAPSPPTRPLALAAPSAPVSNARECPDDDRDGDGVPNRCDRCPTIPGGRDGCPVLIDEGELRILYIVPFATNTRAAELADGAGDALVKLSRDGAAGRLGIVGHASSSEAGELALSRAKAVRDLLVKRGAPESRLEVRAAPPGDLDECHPADGGGPLPCVSFAIVDREASSEKDGWVLRWNGRRYVMDHTKPAPPFVCPTSDPSTGPCATTESPR